ncbi:apolipoprotein N-acyltransferase [Actinomadura barringtoniae]|uniref:Apolipoprotein N-acyltransferase n=1 Tax=Actinomadura barringtoniae TaxID=1427535 RepID=A0A939PGK8_9ACTN|nr:apolipoprotein N-acyltransferase [Actinomadura barringtoniae]MBO2451888.1 apolipoprotein N-acyltransferase [Actinomadura barringtoniae]
MIGRLALPRSVRLPWERVGSLAAGVMPLLAFPRADFGWLAWVVLVPGMLLMLNARDVREAALRGWWFGAGFLLAALYWTLPDIGPGLPLLAIVFGVPWAAWGAAVRWLMPERPLAALVVLPNGWLAIELIRSWPRLGGPWALLGATQWRYPAVLSLASVGGVWLISVAIVAVNTLVVLFIVRRRVWPVAAAAAILLAGPLTYTLTPAPPAPTSATPGLTGGGGGGDGRMLRVALVQPGIVHDPAERLAASEGITAGLPAVDLVVWGESSVGYDLDRRTDIVDRLTALNSRGDLLVNEDARDARGRISKSSILVGRNGPRDRYVKTRLVPFGEYIPFRSSIGWLSRISAAASEDRVPGTGPEVMSAGGTTIGPLICFESTFPDLARTVVNRGAQVIVYQSSTSSFQDSWAPRQHAALGAVRAAETGRPVVQAALTGVSAAYDSRGRRLTHLDTDGRGATLVTLRLPNASSRTLYDRWGNYVPCLALAVTFGAAAAAAYTLRRGSRATGARRDRPL